MHKLEPEHDRQWLILQAEFETEIVAFETKKKQQGKVSYKVIEEHLLKRRNLVKEMEVLGYTK